MHIQWRHQDFFREGGMPRPLKGYHAPPAGGPETAAPGWLAKCYCLKRFKEIENESIFQKYQHFSFPKNQFFLRKISKNSTYFTKISEFFRKLFLLSS